MNCVATGCSESEQPLGGLGLRWEQFPGWPRVTRYWLTSALSAVAKLPEEQAVAVGRLKICRTQPLCLDVPSPVIAGKNQVPKKHFLKNA